MSNAGCAFAILLQLFSLSARWVATGADVSMETLELWKDGDDEYSILSTSLVHNGPCEPHCTEERYLVLSPRIPYKVSVEVLQVDMHATTEFVEVDVNGMRMLCNPSPPSDYNCSFWTCGDRHLDPLHGTPLLVSATSHQTRDACKCISSGEEPDSLFTTIADWDCYSAEMSDFEQTVGMLIHFTFTPDVHVGWVTGEWQQCDEWQCAPSTGDSAEEVSIRNVTCHATASGLDVPAPAGRWCSEPEPESERLCSSVSECAPPPLCDQCFTLQHLNGEDGEGWSLVNAPSQLHTTDGLLGLKPEELTGLSGSTLGIGSTARLAFRLKPADYSAWYLTPCTGDLYVAWRAPSNGGDWKLVLSAIEGPDDVFRQIFHLGRVSGTGYSIVEMTGGRIVAAFGSSLVMIRNHDSQTGVREASAFLATPIEGPQEPCQPSDVPSHWPRSACQFDAGWCCIGPEHDGVIDGCDLSRNRSQGATCYAGSVGCNQEGLALLHDRSCEDVGCRPIRDRSACEAAAVTFGFDTQLAANAGDQLEAQRLLSSSYPSYCVWQPISESIGTLWYNARSTEAVATEQFQQMCACSAPEGRTLSWVPGDWGPCGLDCDSQFRYRNVTCVMTASRPAANDQREPQVVDPEQCREADLPEPSDMEPCASSVCFATQHETQCHGPPKVIQAHNLLGLPDGISLLTPSSNTSLLEGAHESHCVATGGLASKDAPAVCRRLCLSITGCAGFTFSSATAGSAAGPARCCFLQRATRWEKNLRHARCDLLQGLRTRRGCHCQVGWHAPGLAGGAEITCGAEYGGCCAIASHGLPAWCPTTDTCGDEDVAGDVCDPPGVTAVTQGTCEAHFLESGATCAHASSVAQCNQLATALRLPITHPVLTHSTHLPAGCTWDNTASRLVFNQLAAPLAHSQASDMAATLCHCPVTYFSWFASEWSECFSDPHSHCLEKQRARHVWCVRTELIGNGTGAVVDDSLCDLTNRPESTTTCHTCTEQVVAAKVVIAHQSEPGAMDAAQFQSMLMTELLAVTALEPLNLFVNVTRCCDDPPMEAMLYVHGSSGVNPGDALGNLMQIILMGQHEWGDTFQSYAATLAITLLGLYTWEADEAWGPCSAPCGAMSQQTRGVRCIFSNFFDAAVVASEDFCHSDSKPLAARECIVDDCLPCGHMDVGTNYYVDPGVISADSNPHGTPVVVTCADGYDTVDDVKWLVSRCEHGAWTREGLECGSSCGEPGIDHTKYEVKGSGVKHGALRHLRCRQPALHALASTSSATSMCKNGAWTQPNIICANDCEELDLGEGYVVSVQQPGNMPNDITPLVATNGTRGTVSCADGFQSHAKADAAALQCINGHWLVETELPECHRDCAPYQLPDGYEVSWMSPGASSATRAHDSSLQLRCAVTDQTGPASQHVPEAVHTVHCYDGHWTPLALLCASACHAINTSAPELQSYSFVQGELDGELLQPAKQSTAASVLGFHHGTVINIGCRGERGAKSFAPGTAALRSKMWCENGLWSTPALECPRACPAFTSGDEYTVVRSSEMTAALLHLHGSRIFATCTAGFSAQGLPSDEPTQGGLTNFALGEALCENGTWSTLKLLCLPDCQRLELGPEYRISGNGSLWVGATLTVSCMDPEASSALYILRCSNESWWQILYEAEEVELDQDAFPLDCSAPAIGFWDKLSEDERALVLCLILLLIGSSGSFCWSCIWWHHFSVSKLKRQFPRRRLASWTALASMRSYVLCKNCQQGEATKACYPCGDLCLCEECAQMFLDRHPPCPQCTRRVELVLDGEPASIYGRAVFEVPYPATLKAGIKRMMEVDASYLPSWLPVPMRNRLRHDEPRPLWKSPGAALYGRSDLVTDTSKVKMFTG